MTSYEFNDYLNFNDTDNFLNSISGGIQSLSPSSSGYEYDFDGRKGDLSGNNEISTDNDKISGDEYKTKYPGSSEYDKDPFASDLSGNESSNTKTDVSTKTNTTPAESSALSQPSLSSPQTSPEPPMVKSETGDFTNSIREQFNPLDVSLDTKSKITKPKKDKSSHNMIEKKYRSNINTKILLLRDAVPSLRMASGSGGVSVADLEGLTPASKLSKANVLTKATEYIKHLESKSELLRQQNLHLQRLIQQANNNPNFYNNGMHMQSAPPQQPPQQPPQHNQQYHQHHQHHQQPPPPPPPQHLHQHQHQHQHHPPPQNQPQNFPIDQSYPEQYNQQSYDLGIYDGLNDNQFFNPDITNQQYPTNQQIPDIQYESQTQNKPNKYLLGGVAAVMGTSLFGGGDSDFRGLAAIPMFPFGQSQVFLQFWKLIKLLLILGCVANILLPDLMNNNKKVKGQVPKDLWKSWVMVSLGLQLPNPIDESKKSEIISRISGKADFSWWILIQDYIYLSTTEVNFENCVLQLLVGTLISRRFSILGRLFGWNMGFKKSILTNLNYQGEDKSLIKLNKLIRDLDGTAIFASESIFIRLRNLIHKAPINCNIVGGQNNVEYAEVYQREDNDLYSVLTGWRLLDVLNELNMVYLDNLDQEDSKEKIDKIIKDLDLMSEVVDEKAVKQHYDLFKTIIIPDDSVSLIKSLKNDVDKKLNSFTSLMSTDSLTDEEELSDNGNSSEETEVVKEDIKDSSTAKGNKYKSLIGTLNLVGDDQFMVLVCSLIIWYNKCNQKNKADKLLKYLSLSDNASLSVLSFTAILKMIETLISKDSEYNNSEILDSLIRISRLWVNESILDDTLKANLSDFIVKKGIILAGGIVEEEEEEEEEREEQKQHEQTPEQKNTPQSQGEAVRVN